MLGFGQPKQVAEFAAEGETERVYHEIKQTLRVSGINLNFRTWAGYDKFFPVMWDAMQPLAETRAFEDTADQVRSAAVGAALQLGRLETLSRTSLGESQSYQIRAALDLYHYINPKLLVFTSAVKMALDNLSPPPDGAANSGSELIERGVPARMYPMEMVSSEPEEKRLTEIFADIKQTLSLSSVNSDYRTLALWPEYLAPGWEALKPLVQSSEYQTASDDLRETSRTVARALPLPVLSLSRARVEQLGEDADKIIKTTTQFEQLLPSLIINVALFALDWKTPETLKQSPFPAAPRRVVVHGGAR